MPAIKFFVKGKTGIIHVSLRPNITLLARDYGLEVACKNLYEENSVEVIVKGESDTLNKYYKAIENFHPRLLAGQGSYIVTPSEPYKDLEPDWNKYWLDVVNESMVTGSSALYLMNENIHKITGMVDEQQKKFHIIGEGVVATKETMNKILGEIHESSSCIKSIDKSLSKISLAADGLQGLNELSKKVEKVITKFFPDENNNKKS